MPFGLSVAAAMVVLSAATQSVPAPHSQARVIAAPAALIFNPIKSTKTADFDLIMRRVTDALAKSSDPIRKHQAAGWKVYKAAEDYQGNVLYVILIDPVIGGADYSISRILAETYPADVQDLYVKFRDALSAGQTLWTLTPIIEQKQ
jgi:hypothetical protein